MHSRRLVVQRNILGFPLVSLFTSWTDLQLACATYEAVRAIGGLWSSHPQLSLLWASCGGILVGRRGRRRSTVGTQSPSLTYIIRLMLLLFKSASILSSVASTTMATPRESSAPLSDGPCLLYATIFHAEKIAWFAVNLVVGWSHTLAYLTPLTSRGLFPGISSFLCVIKGSQLAVSCYNTMQI